MRSSQPVLRSFHRNSAGVRVRCLSDRIPRRIFPRRLSASLDKRNIPHPLSFHGADADLDRTVAIPVDGRYNLLGGLSAFELLCLCRSGVFFFFLFCFVFLVVCLLCFVLFFFLVLSFDHNDKTWPRGYKTFFMLNSVEHGIVNSHKYKNIKKFGFF